MLEKVVTAPPTIDIARAQLELARIYRDLGDVRAARKRLRGGEPCRQLRTRASRARSCRSRIAIRTGGRDTLDAPAQGRGRSPVTDAACSRPRARGCSSAITRAPRRSSTIADTVAERPSAGSSIASAAACSCAAATSTGAAQTLLACARELRRRHRDLPARRRRRSSADDKQAALIDQAQAARPAAPQGPCPRRQIVAGKLALARGATMPRPTPTYQAARKALDDMKATPRRLAQADYGLAVHRVQPAATTRTRRASSTS